jgi:hypothetical protein
MLRGILRNSAPLDYDIHSHTQRTKGIASKINKQNNHNQ